MDVDHEATAANPLALWFVEDLHDGAPYRDGSLLHYTDGSRMKYVLVIWLALHGQRQELPLDASVSTYDTLTSCRTAAFQLTQSLDDGEHVVTWICREDM